MKNRILFVLMAAICSLSLSAQRMHVIQGNDTIATYSISQVDSIAVEQIEHMDYFVLLHGGETVTTYSRLQADRIDVEEGIKVTGITLDKTSLSLAAGRMRKLTATITPDDASDQDIIWTTSDPSVAMVSEFGDVAAVRPGTATITATAADGSGISASCTVEVDYCD